MGGGSYRVWERGIVVVGGVVYAVKNYGFVALGELEVVLAPIPSCVGMAAGSNSPAHISAGDSYCQSSSSHVRLPVLSRVQRVSPVSSRQMDV